MVFSEGRRRAVPGKPRRGASRVLVYLAIALAGAPAARAIAGEQPLYQPAPSWVKPAPRVETQTLTADDPPLLVFDLQTRIDHGLVWKYAEVAARIATADALNKAGTLVLSWSPEHGNLVIHGVDIVRDGKRIDALAGGAKFTILRREAALEQRTLDGVLSATLSVEGPQVGDVLDLRYSTTSKDAALQGHASTVVPIISEPRRVRFGRARLLWAASDHVAWKTYLEGAAPEIRTEGGWSELNLKFPLPKQPDPAPNAPGRFKRPDIIDVSDFGDWASLAATMAPLYQTEGAIKPGSGLDAEVTRIAAETKDPRRRIALALQVVQDKIRYFAVSLNGGNLVPQAPEETWSRRYGDCNAKTLMLLAMLRKLGVEAEPALANLENGDLVRERLPSAAAFNHILVLARLGDKTLWLDGTVLGTREADLEDVAPYHWVLPVRATGATLLAAPPKVPARPLIQSNLTEDARGGIGVLSSVEGVVSVRGPLAGSLKTALANVDKQARTKLLTTVVAPFSQASLMTAPVFDYDEAAGVATIRFRGMSRSLWSRVDGRYTFDTGRSANQTLPDRSRTIWNTIPVEAGVPLLSVSEETILLPRAGEGLVLEGQTDLSVALPGNQVISQKTELRDGALHLKKETRQGGGEYDPSDLPDMRRKLADLKARAPKVKSTAGYAPPWTGVEAAKRAGLYDRAIATLNEIVADKPDDPQRVLARAAFYASIFERGKAVEDLTKALSLRGDKAIYRARAITYAALGEDAKATADLKEALALDPSDLMTLERLTTLQSQTGAAGDALAELDPALANGGANEPMLMAMKATVLANSGDADAAIEQINQAVEKRPGNAQLLNARCWLKATLNRDLAAAVEDCTRAIQMDDPVTAAALDSRALAYLRENQPKAALADLDAALSLRPDAAGSLFLRALVERALGQPTKAAQDIAAARYLSPSIDKEYGRYGLRWAS